MPKAIAMPQPTRVLSAEINKLKRYADALDGAEEQGRPKQARPSTPAVELPSFQDLLSCVKEPASTAPTSAPKRRSVAVEYPGFAELVRKYARVKTPRARPLRFIRRETLEEEKSLPSVKELLARGDLEEPNIPEQEKSLPSVKDLLAKGELEEPHIYRERDLRAQDHSTPTQHQRIDSIEKSRSS